jgi:hypothetical protein
MITERGGSRPLDPLALGFVSMVVCYVVESCDFSSSKMKTSQFLGRVCVVVLNKFSKFHVQRGEEAMYCQTGYIARSSKQVNK